MVLTNILVVTEENESLLDEEDFFDLVCASREYWKAWTPRLKYIRIRTATYTTPLHQKNKNSKH